MASEKLSVILELTAGQYKKETRDAAAHTDRLADSLGKTGKVADTLGEKLGKVGGLASRTGRTLTTNITLPLIAMGAGAIKAASDLGESMNAIGVVFGDASVKVEQFGETAANAAGLSQRAFNEAVIPIGQLLNNFGFAAEDSAAAVIELTQRAADLGSVLNVDTSVALEKFQAGLAGEAEPLKAFGVDVSVAAIQAEALALGLIRVGEPLDKAARAQAAMSIIMRQTAFAAGDFANTLETSLPNQLKALKADAENVAASLGKAMLPAMLDVVKMLKRLADGFADLSEGQQGFIVKTGLTVAALGPALLVLGKLVTVISKLRLGLIGIGGWAGLAGMFSWVPSAVPWFAKLGGSIAIAGAHHEVLNAAMESGTDRTAEQQAVYDEWLETISKIADKSDVAVPKPPPQEVHDSWNEFGADIVEVHDSWQTGIANVQAGLAAELPVMSEAHLAALALRDANIAAAKSYRLDLTNSISAFNTFFSGAVDEIKLTLGEMEANWSETQTQNERFFNGLAVLARAGLDGLVDTLLEQGPAAAGAVDDLVADMDRAFAWERRIEEQERNAALMANALINGINGVKDTVGAAFNAFGISLADQLEAGFSTADLGNTLTQLMDLASGGGSGGSGINNTDIQVRQHGGPAIRGKPYWVGEAGPELMVPGESGTIIPNGSLSAGGVSTTIFRTNAPTIVVSSPSNNLAADLQYGALLANHQTFGNF